MDAAQASQLSPGEQGLPASRGRRGLAKTSAAVAAAAPLRTRRALAL
jgi:hypothetical protein